LAKTSMINKEQTRTEAAQKGKYPRVRLHNRCSICGRPRAYYRQFGLCRIHLRELAHQGKLPGVLKSSW
jgi:small subunit ribosomal protein S14